MKHLLPIILLFMPVWLFALSPTPWSLETAYVNSKDIFIAEVIEVEMPLEVETDSYRVDLETGEKTPVVWSDAQRFTLSVTEVLKGEQPKSFDVYFRGYPTSTREPLVKSKMDEIFNFTPTTKPSARPRLIMGEQYLFFMNRKEEPKITEMGSVLNVERSHEEIGILRLLQNEKRPTTDVEVSSNFQLMREKYREQSAAIGEELKSAYLSILNQNPDLSVRKQKVLAHLEKLGFEGLWAKRESEKLLRFSPNREVLDWIWFDATQEIRKINMVLKARAQSSDEESKEDANEGSGGANAKP